MLGFDAEHVEQLLARMDVELLINVANMGLRCAVRDEQLALNDSHGFALSEQQEHLFFARRQLILARDGRYARREFVLLFGSVSIVALSGELIASRV